MKRYFCISCEVIGSALNFGRGKEYEFLFLQFHCATW